MSKILLITSSPRGEASYSSKVAKTLVETLKAKHSGSSVTHRDLDANPMPHIKADFAVGRTLPAEARTQAQKAALTLSDTLIDEVLAADTIVIASGLINFGIPSTLKSWVDHIAVPGRTFSYSAAGAEGLVKGKKVYLVLAYGGIYSQGAMQPLDFGGPYLQKTFGFLGMTDVQSIVIEGVAYGPEAAEKAVNAALLQAQALAA